ncbi:MAG: class II fructose-bisphosphatase [Rhodospirillales bacterium]|nr:class II fructose-bisphosphatase [Rhodospirillales bacterium]
MAEPTTVDRNLAMEAVRITEATAIAAARFMGRGDEEAADRAAARAMHEALSRLAIDGTIVIGHAGGAEDEHLFVGERIGQGAGPEVAVALLPLEGPTIIAKGEPNGLSVIAMAENGGFLQIPSRYMEKLAVGPGLPENVVDLDAEPAENLTSLARATGAAISDLVVCILDRPRHHELIVKIREAGARIMLIADGDVAGVVAATQAESGIDAYMGVGGAAEGVLAAAALGCIGGQMQGRLVFGGDDEKKRAAALGITELGRKYSAPEMAQGDLTFAATGVTGGAMLTGVRTFAGCAITHSMVLRSTTGTLRYVEAHRNFANEARVQRAGA